MSVRNMSAKDARDNFTDLLGAVYYGNDQVVIEKKGRPFAVVINPEDYKKYQEAARERFFNIASQIGELNKDKSEKEVMEDITEAVEEVRQKKYAQSK